jgi:hypothetical protein
MRFPDEVRKCSAFLQCQLASGRQKLCGSAFFVRIDDTDEGRATKFDVVSFLYLVTARHVVDGIWDTLKKQVQIRVNTTDGLSQIVETQREQWLLHETDAAADVAVLPWEWPENTLDISAFPLSESITVLDMKRRALGVTDVIHSVGLFTIKPGLVRNIPVVRTGTIAAMPEEPVSTPVGTMEAYLVELRSIRGLSGAPVFIPQVQDRTSSGLKLLGVMHGHWSIDRSELDIFEHSKLHIGIGAVAPIERVLEIVAAPALAQRRKEIATQSRSARMTTPD